MLTVWRHSTHTRWRGQEVTGVDCRHTWWTTVKAHCTFATFSRQMKERTSALDQTTTASLLTKLYSKLDVSYVLQLRIISDLLMLIDFCFILFLLIFSCSHTVVGMVVFSFRAHYSQNSFGIYCQCFNSCLGIRKGIWPVCKKACFRKPQSFLSGETTENQPTMSMDYDSNSHLV